ILWGNRRADQPAGEIEDHRVGVIVGNRRHPIPAPHAQIIVQKSRRLMHSSVEFCVGIFLTLAFGVVVDQEDFVGCHSRMEREQMANVAEGNAIVMLWNSVDGLRGLNVSESRRIQLVGLRDHITINLYTQEMDVYK